MKEMNREILEQIVRILNHAVEENSYLVLDTELFDILKLNIVPNILEVDPAIEDNVAINNTIMDNFINFIKNLYVQLSQEDREYLLLNLNDTCMAFIGTLPNLESAVQYVKSLQIIMETEDENLLREFFNIDVGLEKDYISTSEMKILRL